MFQLRKYLITLIALLMALTSLTVKAGDSVFTTTVFTSMDASSYDVAYYYSGKRSRHNYNNYYGHRRHGGYRGYYGRHHGGYRGYYGRHHGGYRGYYKFPHHGGYHGYYGFRGYHK